MVNPTTVWDSSDASSSIYSNDDDEAPIIYSSSRSNNYNNTNNNNTNITNPKPAIARKESTSAHSTTSSTVSRNPTIYSEDSIKSLGYRPFEYWKGPKPAAAPSAMKRPPPPLPPPRFIGTNPMKPINSLQDFKPLPKAKVLEVQSYIKDVNSSGSGGQMQPPSSPRVKDRYAARMAERAERARRKRERNRRIEEWPGWIPDEKIVLGGQQELLRRQVRIDAAAAEKRKRESSLAAAMQEHWLKPRTWRRRVWGVVTTLGVVFLIAVIIVATTVTQDNAPSLRKTPLNVRGVVDSSSGDQYQGLLVDTRTVEPESEPEIEAVSLSSSSPEAPLLLSSSSSSSSPPPASIEPSPRRSLSSLSITPTTARRMARRFRRRHR